jgi:hypothetical protein
LKVLKVLQQILLYLTVLMILGAHAGLFLNRHVARMNGGLMPVVADSKEDLRLVELLIGEELAQGIHAHTIATSETRWVWAADRFYLTGIQETSAFGNDYAYDDVNFLSIGDFLFFLGRRFDGIFALCCCGIVAIRGIGKIIAVFKNISWAH